MEYLNEAKVVEIVKERIEENKELFTDEELKIVKDNAKIIIKIYIISLLDGNKL